MGELRLHATTRDNPYSPFTDWTRWYLEDIRLGYDTLGTLARLASPISDLDDSAIDEALRSLIEYNFSGNHIVVVQEDYDPFLKPQANF